MNRYPTIIISWFSENIWRYQGFREGCWRGYQGAYRNCTSAICKVHLYWPLLHKQALLSSVKSDKWLFTKLEFKQVDFAYGTCAVWQATLKPWIRSVLSQVVINVQNEDCVAKKTGWTVNLQIIPFHLLLLLTFCPELGTQMFPLHASKPSIWWVSHCGSD